MGDSKQKPNSLPHVVFILSKFPCYDEAFIMRELAAFSEKMKITIFSLRCSRDKVIHDEAVNLLPLTIYVQYLFSMKILTAMFRVFIRRPIRLLKALFDLKWGNIKSPEFLMKNLAFFPKSIYLADWAERNKVTHFFGYWATYPASVAMTASTITGIPFSFMGHAHDIYLNTTHLKEKIMRAKFISTCTKSNKDYLLKIAEIDSTSLASPRKRGSKTSGFPLKACGNDNPGAYETASNDSPHVCIKVIHHGLSFKNYESDQKPVENRLHIISVGTLYEHKGHKYLIDAVKILKGRGVQLICHIIGGGPLEPDLRAQISRCGLESEVFLTGAIKHSEVVPYYKQADLLVLMAQSEWHWGIPNVIVEAFAAKVAVITTRFGSVEEVVLDGKTGILVPGKDVQALAHVIEKLFRDRNYLKTLAQAGHDLILQEFDRDRCVNQYIDLFTK
ncbi:MAG: hypothetical protein A3G33_10855 [Omnitrophica bacterium RIFCSPLOWO2_12_FULL_44_17]|uniref:Glycosyl transferase family 1 domain-containing protein n=1 Tax=Candidatus Danuiimicrobium aquiferis TaxID=1801832 RepID=A0A1G1KRD2_9BACT|nr:MAG: hypothetical protein A3B72_03175 [Omnitrophica bacterium RIFCSPHIGHO2_02_FULL_45_28]OGW95468.1 MAG: hypothetical protein A3G33_10855 [Omnitrophica bacterium RIFCSPLOWO2_12_FULL_44_17]OGX03347.1 MAG: hypothetical protein A3J12_07495 [Omnitrophica bacterium RIFCSPLOWO2_02_FULL_44_11]